MLGLKAVGLENSKARLLKRYGQAGISRMRFFLNSRCDNLIANIAQCAQIVNILWYVELSTFLAWKRLD